MMVVRTQKWHLLTERFFFFSIFHDEFDVFTPSHQSERVDLFGHAQDDLFGHAQDPPPT